MSHSAVYKHSYFSTPSPAPVAVCLHHIAILADVNWCLILVLICISLKMNNSKHLFICLMTISMTITFGEMSTHVLCPFLIGLLVFLLFSFKCSLYTLDTSHSSHIWFGNIFSRFVGCLFTYLILAFESQKCFFKILMKSNLSFFSCCLCLSHHIWEYNAISKVMKFYV